MNSNNSNIIDIDGSVLEGGGQILRIALALSAIQNISVRIFNIRQGRSQSGLRPQHLTGVKLIQQMCNGKVQGAEIGSEEIVFIPNKISSGTYHANTGTAGSVALLLQISLPVAYFSQSSVHFRFVGGTNCEMAPQIDYLTEVFRPNLEKMGVSFDFDLIRRGYFPKGGGEISVHLNPVCSFKPLQLCDQGHVTDIFGWSFVSGTLPLRLTHEMADGAIKTLNKVFPNVKINIDRYKEDPEIAEGNCSGIILVCRTSSGCILGGSSLGNRKKSPFQTGIDAANELLEPLKQGACVDKHTQDMLIIFMALAKGKSSIQVGDVTLHTKTAIYIVEKLLKVNFHIQQIGENQNIIECTGIGQENV